MVWRSLVCSLEQFRCEMKGEVRRRNVAGLGRLKGMVLGKVSLSLAQVHRPVGRGMSDISNSKHTLSSQNPHEIWRSNFIEETLRSKPVKSVKTYLLIGTKTKSYLCPWFWRDNVLWDFFWSCVLCLVELHSLWHLSSLTTDWTHVPCSESGAWTTGPLGKSQSYLFAGCSGFILLFKICRQ